MKQHVLGFQEIEVKFVINQIKCIGSLCLPLRAPWFWDLERLWMVKMEDDWKTIEDSSETEKLKFDSSLIRWLVEVTNWKIGDLDLKRNNSDLEFLNFFNDVCEADMILAKIIGIRSQFPHMVPLLRPGTKKRCSSFNKEWEMKRVEYLLILNDGSDLIYGGSGWTCMVCALTPKSIQDSR